MCKPHHLAMLFTLLVPLLAEGTPSSLSRIAPLGDPNGESWHAAVSANGQFVSFTSSASNFSASDTAGFSNVFLYNLGSQAIELVDVSTAGGFPNEQAGQSAVSADARYVAFDSRASDLVSQDTNGAFDVFLRDRVSQSTLRVSAAGGGADANGSSSRPAISSDGRYIAFESTATNLVAGDTNNEADVFVFDRDAGVIERVSVGSGGQANGSSGSAKISDDGRFVVFQSFANNLAAGDANGVPDIFLRDRLSGTTQLVSITAAVASGNGYSANPSISSDGRFVAFDSAASNLVAGDGNGASDIFLFDRLSNSVSLASRSSAGAQANLASTTPRLSGDGRFLAFASSATNLVDGDGNGKSDLFLINLASGAVTRLSVSDLGVEANGPIFSLTYPALSADGAIVAFASIASNLVNGDGNGRVDVFVFTAAVSEPRPDPTPDPEPDPCIQPYIGSLPAPAVRVRKRTVSIWVPNVACAVVYDVKLRGKKSYRKRVAGSGYNFRNVRKGTYVSSYIAYRGNGTIYAQSTGKRLKVR